MYPNLYYAFSDLFGWAPSWLRFINSFGFFVALSFIAAAIVLYMFLKGVSYLNLSEFVSSPSPSLHQTQSGGFSDPIIGTPTRWVASHIGWL